MTIELIGRFKDVFNGYTIIDSRINNILNTIKDDIIEDHICEDPKILVSRCVLVEEPLIYGMQGEGILHIEIVVVSWLSKIGIREYDYKWDNMIQRDQQNKYDYNYDEKFFYVARNDSVGDCGEV